ncbi:MAG TPA: glycosyltransferase [Verrucomicrobiae bacterium]|jgi:glycosyltransferase involved in cell wall biosynthesis
MGKLCIIGVDDNKVLKDFIRAHVDYLDGEKVCLSHWYPEYKLNGRTIRYFYSAHPTQAKLLKLLPQFLYHRLVTRRELSEAVIHDALKGLFRDHQVDVILAEFGTTGADICGHAERLNIPLIVHFHGHDAHRTSVVEEYKVRYRRLFDCAFKILSVSNYMTDALIRLGADPSKIVYNPYGPRESFFEVRPNYQNTILAVGRFTDIKAPQLTLMAFKLLQEECPDVNLVMVGDEGLLESCKTLAKVWGVESKVSFPGAVNHAEVLPLFAQACCFVQHSVCPSYGDAEGTPVAILEAGAAGLPVVSTRHAGIKDAVVHGKTGFLVEERDVVGMKNHLRALIGNKQLCKQMGEAAREHIRVNYNIKRHIACIQEQVDAARRQ